MISYIFLRMLRVLASEIIDSNSLCLLVDDYRLFDARLRAVTYSDGTLNEMVNWISLKGVFMFLTISLALCFVDLRPRFFISPSTTSPS